MARRFDFAKWREELSLKDKETKEVLQKMEEHPHLEVTHSTKGVSYVFKLLFNEPKTAEINFNAFTFEDAKIALECVNGYTTSEDIDVHHDNKVHTYANKGNGFHEARFLEWSMDELVRSSKKVYDEDDNFI